MEGLKNCWSRNLLLVVDFEIRTWYSDDYSHLIYAWARIPANVPCPHFIMQHGDQFGHSNHTEQSKAKELTCLLWHLAGDLTSFLSVVPTSVRWSGSATTPVLTLSMTARAQWSFLSYFLCLVDAGGLPPYSSLLLPSFPSASAHSISCISPAFSLVLEYLDNIECFLFAECVY